MAGNIHRCVNGKTAGSNRVHATVSTCSQTAGRGPRTTGINKWIIIMIKNKGRPRVTIRTCLTMPSKTLTGSLAGDTAPGGWLVILRGHWWSRKTWRRRWRAKSSTEWFTERRRPGLLWSRYGLSACGVLSRDCTTRQRRRWRWRRWNGLRRWCGVCSAEQAAHEHVVDGGGGVHGG